MKKVKLKYILTPGTKEKFIEEIYALDIPAKTRNEDGCLGYDFYVACDKDEIILFEAWEDEQALSRHITMPHLIKLREIKEKYGIITEAFDC